MQQSLPLWPVGLVRVETLTLPSLGRLPSGWLSLDRSVLQRVVQTVGASMWRDAAPDPGQVPMPAVEPKQLPARGLSPELSW